ncbi:MAG: TonB-dependent receptor [Chitinophagaceae bacterium]|nr:TonB-dependent receptor [Chitinophagaceae bacterium]
MNQHPSSVPCRYLLSFFLLFLGFQAIAQETTVTIKVNGSKKDPVSFASISLISFPDNSFRQTKTADSSGTVRFSTVGFGQYTVRITAVNYQPLEKGITTQPNKTSFSFTMDPMAKTLETAVVRSQKPLMRQEDDKTIVDPENLVATSTSGYEVIEKTPGLFVDQDGNIYISSLTPAAIQINGRDMRMSAADVATMLKSLPPNAIAKIEIVRTPSAKYDANSSGGIVNVVLKKGVKIGMTGSINAGMQQGTYGNQFAGFTLNNNDGKKSSSINLNYSKRNSFERIRTNRIFAPDSLLFQDANTIYPGDTYFGSYSLVFPAGKKWDIDFGTSASLNTFNNNSENRNIIQTISNSNPVVNSLNRVNNTGSSLYYQAGLEGTKKLDSAGSEWENDIFYSYSRNSTDQDFDAEYIFPVSFFTGGDGTGINHRHRLNLKEDIRLKMKKRFTLEAGAKASFQTFRNETEYFQQNGNSRIKDIGRTNTFRYDENINSAYVQGSKSLGKDIVIKAGLRLENTNMKGRQTVPGDTSFAIHRTDLFPYIYLSKNLMKIAGYDLRAYLVYRRTISRPGYDQLNPFARYVDQYLTEVGNPALRPQFNQNYEANISVDERPILAVGVNDTKDIFTNVIYQADTSNTVAYRTYDNLGKNREWYFRGLGALPPGGRYFFVAGAQYNHNFYQGLYENKPLSFKRGTWTFFTYQTFKVDKQSVITLNGFWRLKGQQQFYELSSFGALNTSINRKFMKEKLVVTLSMNDIFYSNKNDFTLKQGSVNAYGTRFSDTRRFGINLRYSFGIRKKDDNGDIFNNTEPPAN